MEQKLLVDAERPRRMTWKAFAVVIAAVLLGACGRAGPAEPVALATSEECPRYAPVPRSETGSAVFAALDYIVFNGEVYNRDFSDSARTNGTVEVGDWALETVCRLGFQPVPQPPRDGHASSLPAGTPVFHVVGQDDALVVNKGGEQIVYRPTSK